MEKPDFPLPPGKYMVTGGREVTTVLTIDDGGGWKLDDGAKLHDVTHLPCRSARYVPEADGASPANANPAEFPVTPGERWLQPCAFCVVTTTYPECHRSGHARRGGLRAAGLLGAVRRRRPVMPRRGRVCDASKDSSC